MTTERALYLAIKDTCIEAVMASYVLYVEYLKTVPCKPRLLYLANYHIGAAEGLSIAADAIAHVMNVMPREGP